MVLCDRKFCALINSSKNYKLVKCHKERFQVYQGIFFRVFSRSAKGSKFDVEYWLRVVENEKIIIDAVIVGYIVSSRCSPTSKQPKRSYTPNPSLPTQLTMSLSTSFPHRPSLYSVPTLRNFFPSYPQST